MITPVDYDHLEMLGPELGKIAWEKAGIIKAGRPVVVARQLDEGAGGDRGARPTRLGAPLTLMGRDFDACEERGRLLVQMRRPPARPAARPACSARTSSPTPAWRSPPRWRSAIRASTRRAIAARRRRRRLARPVPAPDRRGRWRRWPRPRGADLWLDGGHNPHAGARPGRAPARACSPRDGRPLVLIVGMLGRKDAAGFFAPFAALTPAGVHHRLRFAERHASR